MTDERLDVEINVDYLDDQALVKYRDDLERVSKQLRKYAREKKKLRDESRLIDEQKFDGTLDKAEATILKQDLRRRQDALADRIELKKRELRTTTALGREILANERVNYQARIAFQRDQQRADRLAEVARQRAAKAAERAAAAAIKEQEKAHESTRRWLFTLRRVVLVYGAIRAAQASVAAVASSIRESLAFGNELETSEKAIAGLIATTFDVRTATGALLGPAEAYRASLEASREQVKALQRDALGSAATFRELNQNFQLAVAPGAEAGFSLDEIREFTLSISQLATALGIEQNQLAEEVRSLFSGAINERNSRIARILSITPEDIKRTREAGVQVEFLRNKFAGIKQSTEDLRNSLPIISSDLRDAALFAGKEGLDPLRESLRQVGLELRGLAINETGIDSPINPKFIEALRPMGEILSRIVRNLNEAKEGFAAFFLSFGEFTAQLLETSTAGSAAFSGLLKVASGALGVVTTGLRVLSALLSKLPEGFGVAVGSLLAFTVPLRIASSLLSKLPKLLASVKPALVGMATGFGTSSTAIAGATVELSKLQKGVVAFVTFGTRLALLVAGIGLAFEGLVNLFPSLRDKFAQFSSEFQLGLFQIFGLDADGNAVEEIRKQLTEGSIFKKDAPFLSFLEDAAERLGAVSDKLIGALIKTNEDVTDEATKIGVQLQSIFITDKVESDFRDSNLLQSVREELADVGGLSGEVQSVLKAQLDLKEAQILKERELVKAINERKDAFGAASKAGDTAEQINLFGQIRDLEADRARAGVLYTTELSRQISLLEKQTNAQRRLTVLEAQRDAAREQAQAGIDSSFVFGDQLTTYFDTLAQVLEIKERINLRDKQQKQDQQILLQLQEDINNAYANRITGTQDGSSITTPRSEAALELAKETLRLSKRQQAADRSRLTTLEKQVEALKNQNTFSAGLQSALGDQVRDLTSAANSARLVSSLSSTVRTGVSDAVVQSLNPESNVDLGLAAEQLGYDIAGSFVQFVLDEAVFQPLFEGLASIFDLNLLDPAAAAQLKAAFSLQTAATNQFSAATALTGAAVALSTAATLLSGGATGAALSSAVPITGFSGGGLATGPAGPSVPGLDPRDRIPAMLRAGEFVATPEMNRLAPGLYSTLEALRHRAHGIGSIGSLPSKFRTSLSGVRGFAEGGAVSAISGRAAGVTVLPVLVKERRELDAMMATPSWARAAHLHRASIRTVTDPRPE